MRVIKSDDGITTIDQDEVIVQKAAGIDLATIQIDGLRPNLDVLAGLYQKAYASKLPEDAAAYVKHKARILAWFQRRDVDRKRYETGEE
ncbi:hypothetical protein [Paenibacillus naphthalenovorans]|uniref:hypothetical protein n=1 Tax=Paenibacillus naphthalenovorans TaxID=162209 RepID=UPI003D2D4A06